MENGEWKMENGKWKMESEGRGIWGFRRQRLTLAGKCFRDADQPACRRARLMQTSLKPALARCNKLWKAYVEKSVLRLIRC